MVFCWGVSCGYLRVFIFFVNQSFCGCFGWLFCVSLGLFYTPCFGVVLALFCGALFSVLCMCCVCFVYYPSRTWLAPVQYCMYATCYNCVVVQNIMQQCEKLHNKTLQTTTCVYDN